MLTYASLLTTFTYHYIYATELTYILYTRKQPDLPISLAYATYMYSYHIYLFVTYLAYMRLYDLPRIFASIHHSPIP